MFYKKLLKPSLLLGGLIFSALITNTSLAAAPNMQQVVNLLQQQVQRLADNTSTNFKKQQQENAKARLAMQKNFEKNLKQLQQQIQKVQTELAGQINIMQKKIAKLAK